MNPGISAPFSLSRAVGTVALLAVLTVTATCVQRAYAAVTAPNHTELTLTANSGSYAATILTIPINNSPVMVTGTTLTNGQRGTGSMHITHALGPESVSWAGVNSTGTTTSGNTTAIMDDILLCGTGAISMGPALNQLRVHNTQAEGFSVQVVVEMIW